MGLASDIRRNALKRVIFQGKFVPARHITTLGFDATNGAANMCRLVPGLARRQSRNYAIAQFSGLFATEIGLLSRFIHFIFDDTRHFTPHMRSEATHFMSLASI